MLNNFMDSMYYFFNGPAKLLYKKLLSAKCDQVCIYGAGEIGEALILEIEKHNTIEILSIVDRKAEYLETFLDDKAVSSPSTLASVSSDTPIVIASEAFLDEILARIQKETSNDKPNVIHI